MKQLNYLIVDFETPIGDVVLINFLVLEAGAEAVMVVLEANSEFGFQDLLEFLIMDS